MDYRKTLCELVATPGPPGEEKAVLDLLVTYLEQMSFKWETDAKGNLLVRLGEGRPKIVVTAHMDEIAMMVRRIETSGRLRVGALGGLFAWKLGEGPVQVMAQAGPIDGILSFGSIHTADPGSTVRQAVSGPLEWEMAHILTGLSGEDLLKKGVLPGTRVVVSPARRKIVELGPLIGSYFLDDRADLVSWLLALEALKDLKADVLFAATAAEEVGGEGALYILNEYRPDVCIALELGPDVGDAPVDLTDQPTVWVSDSYSMMAAADVQLLAELGRKLGMGLQFQALSRGGSDASCAASHGLCGRPITLGLPMENSHGFEVMHPEAIPQLARLTEALVRRLAKS
ncbi:MAG TPA: M20/M25/M40 family metallo-hydrolase [Fimbriimonas sp.]|nr:M20/M25/M40 family metallo-hydrolase [Fimbriimonas sp.]